MRIVNLLVIINLLLFSYHKAGSQTSTPKIESFALLYDIEKKLDKGELTNAKRLLHGNRDKILQADELDVKIEQLSQIYAHGMTEIKKKRYVQALTMLRRYRNLNIFNGERLTFIEAKIQYCLDQIASSKLEAAERTIVGFELLEAIRNTLSKSFDIKRAKTLLLRANQLAVTNSTLKTSLANLQRAIPMLESIESFSREKLSPAEIRSRLVAYRELEGVPVIQPLENNINRLTAIIEDWYTAKGILDKCQLNLLASLSTLTDDDRSRVDELNAISSKITSYYNIDSVSTDEALLRLEKIYQSAFESQFSLANKLSDNLRSSVAECLNENKAEKFRSLGWKAKDIGQPSKSIEYFEVAVKTTSDSLRKADYVKELEQIQLETKCSLEQFTPQIQQISAYLNDCKITQADSLWNLIKDLPGDECTGTLKIRLKYVELGLRINKLKSDKENFTNIQKQVQYHYVSMSNAERKRLLSKLRQINWCDKSEVAKIESQLSRPHFSSYLALGYEGGLVAPYGGRLELMSRHRIGIFGNIRSSLVSDNDIKNLPGTKNKNEVIGGISLAIFRNFIVHGGAGMGYYKLFYRNDYSMEHMIKQVNYKAIYGGVSLYLFNRIGISGGAASKYSSDGLYLPEYTLGVTYKFSFN